MTHHMYTQFRTNLHVATKTDNALGKRFVRYSIFGWGIPAILLVASILVQYHDKGGKLLDTATLKTYNCWFLDNNALMYGMLVPSVIMVLAIIWYMIRAAIVSRYAVTLQVDKKIRDKIKRRRRLQMILFAKITFLICGVIALGALSKLRHSDAIWIAYHVGQGLQGILVAILVTCNCQILKLYSHRIRTRNGLHMPKYNAVSKHTTVTKSTSLQLLTWEPAPDAV